MWIISSILIIILFLLYWRYNYQIIFYSASCFFVLIILWFYSLSVHPYICLEFWKHWLITLITLSYITILLLTKDDRSDIYLLKFFVWLGSLGLIVFNHLILFYIALELQTFSLFILIAKDRIFIKGAEASLKYFILSALSSGILLLSITSLFNLTGLIMITDLVLVSYTVDYIWVWWIFLACSLLFKLAIFPLHFWVADIYEGSSVEVLGLLSTLPKISIINVVIELDLPSQLLLYCGLGSIIIGALGGLNQIKIKRLLGYSGIGHLGFIILILSLSEWYTVNVSLAYLTLYIITALGILHLLNITPFSKEFYLIDLSGLNHSSPLFSMIWALLLFSLAGLPPLSGFIIKWWVVLDLIQSDYFIISILILFLSAISISYYIRIVKLIYFQKQGSYTTWFMVLNQKEEYFFNVYILGWIVYINGIIMINPTILVTLINWF